MFVFVKSTSYSCPTLTKLDFLGIFSKNIKISNFMEIRPVEAELFHTERRTDIKKLIVVSLNFAKEPKNKSKLD
jgi:hypothetical protein